MTAHQLPPVSARRRIEGFGKDALETGRNRLLVTAAVLTLAFVGIGARLVDLSVLNGTEPAQQTTQDISGPAWSAAPILSIAMASCWHPACRRHRCMRTRPKCSTQNWRQRRSRPCLMILTRRCWRKSSQAADGFYGSNATCRRNNSWRRTGSAFRVLILSAKSAGFIRSAI